MTDADIGWSAGILDGEGCIRCQKPPNCGLNVGVGNTDPRMLDKLQALWGGTIRPNGGRAHSPEANAKPFYLWSLNGKKAFAFLEAVLPHLSVKRERAEKALELRSVYGKKDNYHPERASEWRAKRVEVYHAIRTMNQIGATPYAIAS